MKAQILYSALISLALIACKKNTGTVQQTYFKAVAQYENVNKIRKSTIESSAKPIDNTGKIFFGRDMILIGEENKGIHVINNSNKSNPTPVSFIDLPYTNEFYVHNDIIYAISHYDLVKIDVSNPYSPQLIDRLENAFGATMKDADGNILVGFTYQKVTESFKLGSKEEMALRNNNTLYYDFQNEVIPFSEVPSSFIGSSVKNKGTLNRLAFDNDFLYVIGNKDLHTFSDNGSSVLKSSKKEIGIDLETIYTKADKIYVGTSSEMIILSKTSSPNIISTYEHEVTCDPVLPHGNIAYLTLRSTNANGCGGDVNILDVVDITNASSPIQINEVDLSSPYGMAIMGNRLFVAEGNNGISILDISTPSQPELLATHPNIKVFDVLKHPTTSNTILTTGEFGLKQYTFNASNNSLQELSEIIAP